MTRMPPAHRSRRLRRFAAACLVAGAAGTTALGLAGCRGDRSDKTPRQFLPDMDDSPKWKPQAESAFFADGRSMRPRPEGAVPFGMHSEAYHLTASSAQRDDMLRDDTGLYTGRDEEGNFLTVMPASVQVDASMLERGRERYTIYCSACHGYLGEGGYPDGTQPVNSSAPVGRWWSYPVPGYHDPKYKDPAQRTGKDGYLFDVVRHGVWDEQLDHSGNQKMPGYGHALSERDAWAVVAYLRALQRSRTTDLESVPEQRRPAEGERPAPQSAGTVASAQENVP